MIPTEKQVRHWFRSEKVKAAIEEFMIALENLTVAHYDGGGQSDRKKSEVGSWYDEVEDMYRCGYRFCSTVKGKELINRKGLLVELFVETVDGTGEDAETGRDLDLDNYIWGMDVDEEVNRISVHVDCRVDDHAYGVEVDKLAARHKEGDIDFDAYLVGLQSLAATYFGQEEGDWSYFSTQDCKKDGQGHIESLSWSVLVGPRIKHEIPRNNRLLKRDLTRQDYVSVGKFLYEFMFEDGEEAGRLNPRSDDIDDDFPGARLVLMDTGEQISVRCDENLEVLALLHSARELYWGDGVSEQPDELVGQQILVFVNGPNQGLVNRIACIQSIDWEYSSTMSRRLNTQFPGTHRQRWEPGSFYHKCSCTKCKNNPCTKCGDKPCPIEEAG